MELMQRAMLTGIAADIHTTNDIYVATDIRE
jgi:hypothetical protein